MDAEKRNFLKTAKKWPKAMVPYKIDKKSIGKLLITTVYVLSVKY